MLSFVKLGGSLITDKRIEASFRAEVMARLAQEIQTALVKNPELRLLVGHGSGSFGHFTASQYGTVQGVHSSDQWRGFAEVATVAAELNYLVARELQKARVPVWRIQPSASARCQDGSLRSMEVFPIKTALEKGLVPLVYGDVALDDVRGGTIISTEMVFGYLARHLPVNQIVLFGEVEGVYDERGIVIPRITPKTLMNFQSALTGSAGVDVTGGMLTKVRDMLALVEAVPGLKIRIIDGTQPNLLLQTLLEQIEPGTLLVGD
ncbi:MAG: isopentenyl phosphate kinase family protein [Chitinophagaceae bacterium]|nr:isopentenyl phosphate kinase family protein [Anaerolineae bacterium]